MIRAYVAEDVRRAEQPLLDAGEPLMDRASRALAHTCRDLLREKIDSADGQSENAKEQSEPRVLVLAGPGTNGGDGLYAAAHLREMGILSAAIAVMGPTHKAATAALRRAGGAVRGIDDLTAHATERMVAEADLVVDAIVGLSARAEAPVHLQALLETVRRSGVPVVAVDAPSFTDPDSGAADPHALTAVRTLTFGAAKRGLLLPPAADLVGELEVVDIGLGDHLPAQPEALRLTDEDARLLMARPVRADTKYTRGVVAIAAGSDAYPGAAVLACAGAARTGAGMVRLLAPRRVIDLVLHSRPEVVGHELPGDTGDAGEPGGAADGVESDPSATPQDVPLQLPQRTDALVVGPGMPPHSQTARRGVAALSSGTCHRGVIDAGALSAVNGQGDLGADVVLTPHRGEAERLAERLGIDTHQDPASLAEALAARTGATVLLKGAVTLVAPGDGSPLLSQDDGVPQLATAGTGDVLAGIIGTLLASGLDGPRAAALGALLHGRAGRLASRGGRAPLAAADLPTRLPEVIGTILCPDPAVDSGA